MTRINTKTHCDLSGCDHFIVGPTRGEGWTIWMGKDLCPEHDVSEMVYVYPENYPEGLPLKPGKFGGDNIPLGATILYDTPNHMRNVDSNQIVFRTVTWCTSHDSKGNSPEVPCDLAAFAVGVVTPCVFTDKLIEV